MDKPRQFPLPPDRQRGGNITKASHQGGDTNDGFDHWVPPPGTNYGENIANSPKA
jgi:hypothetical protein